MTNLSGHQKSSQGSCGLMGIYARYAYKLKDRKRSAAITCTGRKRKGKTPEITREAGELKSGALTH